MLSPAAQREFAAADKDQVHMHRRNHVPATAELICRHETSRTMIMRLRHSCRVHPDAPQRRALASAFGCARVAYAPARKRTPPGCCS